MVTKSLPADLPRVASDAVGRRPKPKEQHAVHVGFRLPPDLLRGLDKEAEHVKAETGVEATRTQLIVALVRQALEARAKSRGDR